MTTLALTRADLARHVTRHLGWRRDQALNETQSADMRDILGRAERMFYDPEPLPNERDRHQWTFRKPVARLTTKDGIGDYDLPDDFGGILGDLTWSDDAGTLWSVPVKQTSDEQIRRMRLNVGVFTAAPLYYAVVPLPSQGNGLQKWSLLLDRSQLGALTFRYSSNPYQMSEDSHYPLGGQPHAETLLAAAIAAADAVLNDDPRGVSYEVFVQHLRSSVSHDRQQGPRNLGYIGDGPGSDELPMRTQRITFESVLREHGV